ncbi:uncharacterized protein [Montipora foliosa]|uniref:uncharacterized protein n=1 Tax=Montipora foliosa TaxID=591990 RepID=UPI0035F146D8
MSFTEDNLLVANGPITHHGANVTADEELTPTLENMVVLTWLQLIHTALPALVKQRYRTELRSKTLASLKPEISQALDSLLEEIRSTADTKVLRTTASRFRQPPSLPSHKPSPSPWAPTKRPKSCPLCKQAGRNDQHFLSSCSYLPPEDRSYLSRSRLMSPFDDEEPDYVDYAPPLFTAEDEPPLCTSARSVSRRVSTKQSPHFKAFYKHYPIQLTLDTGAETSMIKSSLARSIGAPIMKSSQQALQADGLTPLAVGGETRLILSRADNQLTLDAHVVDDLDVDVLAGTPFLIANDISVRPAKCQVRIQDSEVVHYEHKSDPTTASHAVCPPLKKRPRSQYSRNQLVELQAKFDELEQAKVFRRPEDLGITVEYLNPSFLVKKPSGGHRLVTAFADVARYSKPQPSLMPDVDSILRTIAPWRYMIKTDLTRAFYQILLSKSSLKYCGVATPFRGIRVYTRSAMGMPGSETALEEMMCRVLSDFIEEGFVAKLADDLYCGADTPEGLLHNWQRVLQALDRCNLRLSPTKTVICPKTTSILGWIWSQGSLSANPHRIAALASCPLPSTVKELRSFISAYKVLSRVLPNCSNVIDPLECALTGLQSSDRLMWDENLTSRFKSAQDFLSNHKAIVLPRPTDTLWIVTDRSVTRRGLGATLYVSRVNQLHLAGFFSAKLRKHQVTWLPCEFEALSIAASVKHFSPFIIQSQHPTTALTDSKPCVQAIDKLCRGEFSASPCVTLFLTTVSRYQVHLQHLAGRANLPSDFTCRNAPDCSEPNCQICNFVHEMEDSVVRNVSIHDILNNKSNLPITTRSAWGQIQNDCPDLRRVHAHLKQGTRPSKKLTNILDVKRYLNSVSIASDGLLVVKRTLPLAPVAEAIVVPRSVLDGLLTALHIKLNHPSRHQFQMVVQRQFFALDMNDAISRVTSACHTCASQRSFPSSLVHQSSEDPPEIVGISFAADVIKRHRQLILVLRECATSFTASCLVPDEKHDTLRDALTQLIVGVHPLDGPRAVIRVDPSPGSQSMANNDSLNHLNVTIEVGRVKNKNKNPVAEKAVRELEDELIKQEPGGRPVSAVGLALATARLNSRLRLPGLSSRELWTQRNQFTHEQLPLSDYNFILVSDHSGPQASQDRDDEPSPVTPALPAASVPPESPAPAPPELTSVPSDEVQFPSSACGDTTLDAPIGVPPLLALQEEPRTIATAPDQALSSCPSSSPESPSPRPQRQRKPPSYLNDYVRF